MREKERERERERSCAQVTVLVMHIMPNYHMSNKRRDRLSRIAGNPMITAQALRDSCLYAFDYLDIGARVLSSGDTIVALNNVVYVSFPLACEKLQNPTDSLLFHGTKAEHVKDSMYTFA